MFILVFSLRFIENLKLTNYLLNKKKYLKFLFAKMLDHLSKVTRIAKNKMNERIVLI